MTTRGRDLDCRSNAGSRRFIFGVSGHRDLVSADVPQLRGQIQTLFSRFRAAYPDVSFQLLSPLAEGADRLAAEVALSSQIKLLVPMPMAQKEYERDFPNTASLSEFRRLLAAADSQWEVRDELAKDRSATRTEQYAAVGDFIARKSDVLLLLWDGLDNEKIGGTAWVKKRREYWVNTVTNPLRQEGPLSYGPTIQIATPRASAIGGPGDRLRIEIIGDLPPGELKSFA